jgi:hypothetical protein
MTGEVKGNHSLRSTVLTSGLLLISLVLSAFAGVPVVSAQTPQYIAATPNYVNLGMNTSIAATAPAAGSYTMVVQAPNGTQYSLPLTFTAANIAVAQTNIFGNTTVGFKAMVNQVGLWSVYLEQGTTVVSSNTFAVTNKLNIFFTMIVAGGCVFVPGGSRGQEMLAQFHITYVSNGATAQNAATWVNKTFTRHAMTVKYTLPDKTVATATLHASTATTWNQPWYQGHVWPAWNASWVGNYYPQLNATDQYGNTLTWTYSGYPVPIAAATLSTTVSLTDAKSGALVAGLYNGQSAIVTANILYVATPGVGVVAGFVSSLDTATRGGVVTALVGYGPYNATSGTFGAKNLPGGLIATVPMTYSATTKLWTGPLNIATLPALVNATAYSVVISSHDKASPANTGFANLAVPPFSALNSPTTTSTSASVSTTTATVTGPTTTATATVTGPTTTSTATATVSGPTTTATSVSVVTSTKTSVSTNVQTNTQIPWWAYALIIVFLVEIGIPVGYMMRSAVGGKQQASPQEPPV